MERLCRTQTDLCYMNNWPRKAPLQFSPWKILKSTKTFQFPVRHTDCSVSTVYSMVETKNKIKLYKGTNGQQILLLFFKPTHCTQYAVVWTESQATRTWHSLILIPANTSQLFLSTSAVFIDAGWQRSVFYLWHQLILCSLQQYSLEISSCWMASLGISQLFSRETKWQ